MEQGDIMKGCEHGDKWPEAAAFAKLDHKRISEEQVVKIQGFSAKLWQYQYLSAFVMLKFALDQNKRGAINAEEPGLGKVVLSNWIY